MLPIEVRVLSFPNSKHVRQEVEMHMNKGSCMSFDACECMILIGSVSFRRNPSSVLLI